MAPAATMTSRRAMTVFSEPRWRTTTPVARLSAMTILRTSAPVITFRFGLVVTG